MQKTQELKQKARALELQGDVDGALAIYNGLDAEAMDATLLGRIGKLKLRSGDLEAATAAYRDSAARLLEAGLVNAAIAVYRRMLRADPGDAQTRRELIRLLVEQGYRRDAEAVLLEYADAVAEGEQQIDPFIETLESLAAGSGAQMVLAAIPTIRERLPQSSTDLDRIATAPRAPASAPDVGIITGFDSEPGTQPGVVPTSLAPDRDELEVAPLEGLQTHGAEGPAAEDQQGDSDDALPLVHSGFEREYIEPDEQETLRDPEILYHRPDDPAADAGHGDGIEEIDEGEDAPSTDPLPLLGFDAELQIEADSETDAAATLETAATLDESEVHDWVDLGALVLSDADPLPAGSFDRPAPPSPASQAESEDFTGMLRSLGVDPASVDTGAENGSHYDLGLAFKEMGLSEKAVGHLLSALLTGANPLAVLEELGECYLTSGDPARARIVLERATELDSAEELELVGVRYFLGRCHEAQGDAAAAREEYGKVMEIDPGFRDAGTRLRTL